MQDKIFRFSKCMLGDVAEAEDVVQDVFEKLWTRRNALEECTNPEGFVMQSVKNLCCDRLRRQKVRNNKLAQIKNDSTSVADGNRAEQRDMKHIVEEIIARLPEKQRIVIHMRDVEGWEMDEIARMADMQPEAVRVTLSRARKTVRETMIKTMNYGIR